MSQRDHRALASRNSTALDQLRMLARVWDELIRLPVVGRRIGLDAILGLLPGVGDVAAAVVASWGLVVAYRLGLPTSVLIRMAGNIAVDTMVGAIPLLGDLFDIGWRAQRRNVSLLERWLDTPHAVQRSSRAVLLALAVVMLATVTFAVWLAVTVVQWIL